MSPLEKMPPDVRELANSVMKLLALYMPGATKIEMMVGRNCTATLTIQGGPITREVIEDTLAHLAFYKKYFPKDAGSDAALSSPEKILEATAAIWEQHRNALAQAQTTTSQ